MNNEKYERSRQQGNQNRDKYASVNQMVEEEDDEEIGPSDYGDDKFKMLISNNKK